MACALDIIGDRWTLLIIRDLLCGKTQFKEFNRSPERIATNILADRLAKLVGHGLIEKHPSPESPGRDAYRLSARGKTLIPVMREIAAWGLTNIPGTAALMQPKT